jgi:hypothetical protein
MYESLVKVALLQTAVCGLSLDIVDLLLIIAIVFGISSKFWGTN